MMITRWVVHCDVCGYLKWPEYPAQWAPDRHDAYRFHHKRDALGVVAVYLRTARQHLFVEPVSYDADAIFD